MRDGRSAAAAGAWDRGGEKLANLLPRLRDVRAPLSAGCIWLLTLWLMVEHGVPTREQARGVWASLYRLDGLMGPDALLAAAAFAAFLIGAMPMVRVATVKVQEARKTARLRTIQTVLRPWVSKLAFDDLVRFLQAQGRVPISRARGATLWHATFLARPGSCGSSS
jgi:hypothetical protein